MRQWIRQFTSNETVRFGGCLLLGLAGIALIGYLVGPRGLSSGGAPGGPVIGAQPQPPKPFTSKEGKAGWSVLIPGGRPLATPALADGKVFLGGGFGSYEFYAFDAQTGKQLWTYHTGDDGPTAAVVEDGYVAFNTESCELEVLTTAGKPLWKKRLGDPLMSMPAAAGGKVYMAFPEEHTGQHHLACFDLKTGQEHWRRKIAGEVITAPVIDGNSVYVATLEGTLHCFGRTDGAAAWSEQKNATSSPAVCGGKLFFSQREAVANPGVRHGWQQKELIAYRVLDVGGYVGGGYHPLAFTARHADYLDPLKRKEFSGQEQANLQFDSSVGFSSAPAAAKMEQAMNNLGQATVAGVWSYQGSRPFAYRGRLFTSMGDTVVPDPAGDRQLWAKSFPPAGSGPLVDAALTPPALANGKAFLGTRDGQVLCLDAETGTELWRATVGGTPIIFQPAVGDGRVYVSTSAGRLFCIETGDPSDHGWLMWGGTAAHNGLAE